MNESFGDAHTSEPWHLAWPAANLEPVNACPVCSSHEKRTLHSGLKDLAFRSAAGKWTIWRCAGCGCAYLDPRPDQATIGHAYSSYYTHATAAPARGLWTALRGHVHGVREALSADYERRRFGAPGSAVGKSRWLPLPTLPVLRRIADREYRHLPAQPGPARLLLDVGCGDGSFLARARSCGWKAIGLEPDPRAAAVAREKGLEVTTASLHTLEGQVERFDAITLSHVIEHLHDPMDALRHCFRLLAPGGQIWLETPNIDSLGHSVFGASWRGLEPPRHLVLFNRSSLLGAITSAGFTEIEELEVLSPRAWVFERSWELVRDEFQSARRSLPFWLRVKAFAADRAERWRPDLKEFLTVRALKPAAAARENG